MTDKRKDEIFLAELTYPDFSALKDAIRIGINFAECYGIRHDTDETTVNIYRDQLNRLEDAMTRLEKMEKTLCLKD